MEIGLIAQHCINGLMLGLMYALVAVGFTLFFGVLDVINFTHGDVLMVGAFVAFSTFLISKALGLTIPILSLTLMVVAAVLSMALLGALMAKVLVLPLKGAPRLNVFLVTLMAGTFLRECIRLFFPDGGNPKPFPGLLPRQSLSLGNFNLRLDNVILLVTGILVIVFVHVLINRTRLGLAVRAVAQDEETARIMGINFNQVVYITFALGSGLAAAAAVMNGLYYNEINFTMGLLLGIIGFSAAVIGGLGNIYGAIIGGFAFSFLQTMGAAVLPFASAYKDVFAFGVVILILAWRPSGLIRAKVSERV